MRIAVDAMGGDNAPHEIVAGCVEASGLLSPEDEIVLLGPEAVIKEQLSKHKYNPSKIRIVDAPEVIGMDESPVDALRKKKHSSINIMNKMASDGEVDGVISAGNTGACVAASQMRMRNLEGINRPGIAVVIPTVAGPVVLCDVGANIACKPINLYQYAVMASLYSTNTLGIKNPRIGIVSIGEEDAKGNEVVKKAREFIKADEKLNLIGNIEGRDIFKGACDVAICDGFVGNVVLKLMEGMVEGLFKAIKHELLKENFLLAWRFKSVMLRIYSKYDYNEYGGAPLLGVNGTSVISHGSSKARTIKNAILKSKMYHTQKINEQIVQYIATSSVRPTDEQ